MAISWQKKSAHTPYDIDLVCRYTKTKDPSDNPVEINTHTKPMMIVCKGADLEELLKGLLSALSFIKERDFSRLHCNMDETPDTWWPGILVKVAQSLYTVSYPHRSKDYTIYVSPG